MVKIVGIVNITTDSFSDGGKFINAETAIAQAKKLLEEGADIIELSGSSSNPRSEPVASEIEIQRIASVLEALHCPISIDAAKPEVQKWALAKGVAYLNDIKGFPNASLYPELARAEVKLVVMHAITGTDKADRVANTKEEVFASMYSFFEERLPRSKRRVSHEGGSSSTPGWAFSSPANPKPRMRFSNI